MIDKPRQLFATGVGMIIFSSQVYQLKHQHWCRNWRMLELSLHDFVVFEVFQQGFCYNCPKLYSNN